VVSLFAFLHHLAAFALVSALVVESVLTKGELTPDNSRSLLRSDLIFGVSAAVLIIVGVLRVLYFEKGAAYYSHSIPFIAKISLFAIVGLLSIYPTREFLSWRKSLRESVLPVVPEAKMRTIRMILRLELAGVVLIILCSVLMARGVGVFRASGELGPVKGTYHRTAPTIQHVRVDHGRADVAVAQQFLHRTNVIA
jgi:putative membrane protein